MLAGFGKFLAGVNHCGSERFLPLEKAYHLGDIINTIHFKVINHRSLRSIGGGEDKALVAEATSLNSHWERAADREQ